MPEALRKRKLPRAREGWPTIPYAPYEPTVAFFQSKVPLKRRDFDKLRRDAKLRAFTVATVTRMDILRDIKRAVDDAALSNVPWADFQKSLKAIMKRKGWRGLENWHARLVLDTHVQVAYGVGRMEAQIRNVIAFPLARFVGILDSKIRPTHRALNGKIFRVGSPAWRRHFPPLDFRCILPGQEIAGSFDTAFRLVYAGPVVEIETAAGRRLAVTVNHPIPTARGWLPAGVIEVGDKLFRDPLHVDGTAVQEPDYQYHPPAKIEQAFETFPHFLGTVPTSRVDFDSDGDFGDGEVEIVAVNWKLRHDIEARLRERRADLRFEGSKTLAAARRNLHERLVRVAPAALRIPSRATLTLDGGTVVPETAPLRALRFGPTTQLDTFLGQHAVQGISRNAEFIRNALAAPASAILLDEVVSVRNYEFRGHVFDLQSDSGIIRADSIMIGNCRCSMKPLEPDERIIARPMADNYRAKLTASEKKFAGPGAGFAYKPDLRAYTKEERRQVRKALRNPPADTEEPAMGEGELL